MKLKNSLQEICRGFRGGNDSSLSSKTTANSQKLSRPSSNAGADFLYEFSRLNYIPHQCIRILAHYLVSTSFLFLNFPYKRPIIDPPINQIIALIRKIAPLGKKSFILSYTGAVAMTSGIEYFIQFNESSPDVFAEQFINNAYEIAPTTTYTITKVIPNFNQYFLYMILFF